MPKIYQPNLQTFGPPEIGGVFRTGSRISGRRYPTTISAGTIFATAIDTFIRANANPLSNPMSDGVSTWTVGQGAFNDLQIVSNFARGTTSDSGARVLSPIFSGQHEASITLQTTSEYWGPGVRGQGISDASGYALITSGGNTALAFYKITDSGTISYVQLGSTLTVSPMSTGDIIKLRAMGTTTVTLTAYVNGVSVGTTSDSSSPYTGGQPFIWTATSNGDCGGFSASDF